MKRGLQQMDPMTTTETLDSSLVNAATKAPSRPKQPARNVLIALLMPAAAALAP
jgi:hypothetical protein